MSFPGRRSDLVAFVRRAAAWPARVAAARAAMAALAAMDRRELADIGLNPADLRDVSALALDHDPTEQLAARARERRRGAHAPPGVPSRFDWSAADPKSRPQSASRPRPADGARRVRRG